MLVTTIDHPCILAVHTVPLSITIVFLCAHLQYTGEKLGTAEHTDLDAHFEQLLQRADRTKHYTERLLKHTESVIHPDPSE